MAKLIGKYIVEVFDDGSMKTSRISLEEREQEAEVVNLNDTTGRTGQSLLTIKELIELYDIHNFDTDGNFELRPMVKEAMDKTAKVYGVKIQSVIDKMTRQLNGIEMSELRSYLSEFLDVYSDGSLNQPDVQENLKIKNLLLESVSTRTGKRDSIMITRFFQNPHIEFLYK